MSSPIVVLIAVIVVIVVGLLLYSAVKNLLCVAAPNEAIIFSGSTRKVGNSTYPYVFVRGGRRMRRPVFERVDSMDLSMFTVHVNVAGAFSKGGVPLTIQGVANVKLAGDEPLLANAVERFLGRSREEIYHIAKETLEGNLRGVLASLTPEEVNEDKMRFAHTLVEEAEHDMSRMGLVLDTLKVQNVTDEVNYLSSIGRIRGAELNRNQAIAEAEARADALVQQVSNWAASEVARLEADLQVARQETNKRLADARSRREAMIQESRGQVLAEIAQATAEIGRQKARVLQEKRRLEADVVQPALAKQRAAEESARGVAAAVIERGRAEGEGFRKLVEAFRTGGTSAREVLVLQNLLPMLGSIAGATQGLSIGRVTVLPSPTADGAGAARTAIGANEQIRSATGVDLVGLAKKLSG